MSASTCSTHYLRFLKLFFLSLAVLALAVLLFPGSTKETSAEPYEGEYRSLEEVEEELRQFHEDYPEVTELYDLADHYDQDLTYKGRTIYALKISDNPTETEEDEPDVLLVANHHAREWITYEALLYFTDSLLSNYTGSSVEGEAGNLVYQTRSDYLINNRELWIIPVVNPDGLAKSHERNDRHQNKTNNGWRKNLRDNNGNGEEECPEDGVDLNRNYGYKWGYDDSGSDPNPSSTTYRGPEAFSEPETRMMRALISDSEHQFKTALTYHSYSEIFIYPFGYTELDTLHHTQFVILAEEMSYWTGYSAGNTKSGILYPTNGDFCDYVYGEFEIMPFTVEIGSYAEDGFIPDESRIKYHCELNLEQNYFLTEMAPFYHSLYSFQNCEDLWEVEECDESWGLSLEGTGFGGKQAWEWTSTEEEGEFTLTTDPLEIGAESVLSLWQSYQLGEGAAAYLEVEKGNSGDWQKIIPLDGYDMGGGHGLSYQGEMGWHREEFDLSPFVGEADENWETSIRLRFTVHSQDGAAGEFWTLDDILLYTEAKNINYDHSFELDLDFEEEFLVLGSGEVQEFTIDVTSVGNTMNSLRLKVVGQEALEDEGLEFAFSRDFLSLEPGEEETVILSIRCTRPLSFEESLAVKVRVHSLFPDYQQVFREFRVLGPALVDASLRGDGLFYATPGEEETLTFTLESQGNVDGCVFLPELVVLSPLEEDELWGFSLPGSVVLNVSEIKEIELTLSASRLLPYPKEKRFQLLLSFSEELTGERNPEKNFSSLVIKTPELQRKFSVYLEKLWGGDFAGLHFSAQSWGPAFAGDRAWREELLVGGLIPGAENELRIHVENLGNVNTAFRLEARGLTWEHDLRFQDEITKSTPISAAGSDSIVLLVTPDRGASFQESQELMVVLSLYNADLDLFQELGTLDVLLLTGESHFFEARGLGELDGEGPVGVLPGEEQVFGVMVENTGNMESSYQFTSSLDEDWSLVFDPGELTLEPGEQEEVLFSVAPPANVREGQLRYCEITLSCLEDNSEKIISLEFLALKSIAFAVSVDKASQEDALSVKPGEILELLVTVDNLGNAPAGTSLSVEGLPAGWEWEFQERDLDLGYQRSKTTVLELRVPGGAPRDTELGFLVVAQGDGAREELQLNLKVQEREDETSDTNGSLLPGLALAFGLVAAGTGYFLVKRRSEGDWESEGEKEEHAWDEAE